jgi:hypothetical protein
VKYVLPVHNGDQIINVILGAILPVFCEPARSQHPDHRVSSNASLGFAGDHIGTATTLGHFGSGHFGFGFSA